MRSDLTSAADSLYGPIRQLQDAVDDFRSKNVRPGHPPLPYEEVEDRMMATFTAFDNALKTIARNVTLVLAFIDGLQLQLDTMGAPPVDEEATSEDGVS